MMNILQELKNHLTQIAIEMKHIERTAYDDDEDAWNEYKDLCERRESLKKTLQIYRDYIEQLYRDYLEE